MSQPPPAHRPAEDWADQYHAADVATTYDRRYRGPIRRLNNQRIWRAVQQQLIVAGGGAMPQWVVDVPAGTGRYTDKMRAAGSRVVSLDLSGQMLSVLRGKHGGGMEVVGDLHHSPLALPTETVLLSLRLMQHFTAAERVAALKSLRQIATHAVIAYYPGWDYKNRLRRLRHRVGLPARVVREFIPAAAIRAEAEAAGWNLLSLRRVFPVLSENVLLTLQAC